MPDIPIRLRDFAQLFDSLDPAPFREKALDPHAEEYLVESVEDFGPGTALRVVVHLPESLRAGAPAIAPAIHAHFRRSHTQAERRFLRRMRTGRVALAAGTAVLVAALVAREWLARSGVPDGAVAIVGEGMLILGWVAMWRPVEMLLYERWEMRRHHQALRRLAEVDVVLAFEPEGAFTPN